MEILSCVQVKDLKQTFGHVFTIKSTGKVLDAIKKMAEEKIHCLPVIEDNIQHPNRLIGVLHMLDLVALLVEDIKKSKGYLHEAFSLAFFSQPISDVIPAIGHAIWADRTPILLTNTITECLPRFHVAAHELPVVDEDGNVLSVLSQSDILAFLFENRSLFQRFKRPVKSFTELVHPCISIREDAPAFNAFEVMASQKVTGIAVTDGTGRIVNNISAADLWHVIDFFELSSVEQGTVREVLKYKVAAPTSPIVAIDSEAVESIIAKMHTHKVARVYIVSEHLHHIPYGVVSQTDVIKLLQE